MSHTDTQIRFVEFVGDVPSNGTEVASLLNQRVEETQSKQHLLPLERLNENEIKKFNKADEGDYFFLFKYLQADQFKLVFCLFDGDLFNSLNVNLSGGHGL